MIEPCEEVKRVEQRYEKALDDMKKHYKDVLDKIRAEIATAYTECSIEDYDYASGLKHAMNVIDKYKAEE